MEFSGESGGTEVTSTLGRGMLKRRMSGCERKLRDGWGLAELTDLVRVRVRGVEGIE